MLASARRMIAPLLRRHQLGFSSAVSLVAEAEELPVCTRVHVDERPRCNYSEQTVHLLCALVKYQRLLLSFGGVKSCIIVFLAA